MTAARRHLFLAVSLLLAANAPIAARRAYDAAQRAQQNVLADISLRHGSAADGFVYQWAADHRWPTDAELNQLRATSSHIDSDPTYLTIFAPPASSSSLRGRDPAAEPGLLNMKAVLDKPAAPQGRDPALELRADFQSMMNWPLTILTSLAGALVGLIEIARYGTSVKLRGVGDGAIS